MNAPLSSGRAELWAGSSAVENDQRPIGHGRMLRKEDPRFLRGNGTFVDDVRLPGMLHLAILRSPLAHARIVRVDTTAAQAHPRVKLVMAGADLAEQGVAWVPTLAGDRQAVLAHVKRDDLEHRDQSQALDVREPR